MVPGLLDLSIVTDELVSRLTACVNAAPPWSDDGQSALSVNGGPPDAARAASNTDTLSLYLFHVAADAFYRNTYPTGGSAQRTPAQPLALTMYYLLTADTAGAYAKEQRAMSIAMKCLHERPRVELTDAGQPTIKVTVTLEPQTTEDTTRLWQAISRPLRLSAVYRVDVVFLQPPAPRRPRVVLHMPEPEIEILEGSASAEADALRPDDGQLVEITGEGFAAGTTTLFIRALAASPKLVGSPGPGEFRVRNPTMIDLQLPLAMPAGRYLLRVQPAPDQPVLERWLEVS